MGVTFRIETNDGSIGDMKGRMCWGFLKEHDLDDLIHASERFHSKDAYKDHVRVKKLYNPDHKPLAYKRWCDSRQTMLQQQAGLEIDAAKSGYKAIHNIIQEVSPLKMRALCVLLNTYPKMFTGVTVLDSKRGVVRVSCDDHYGIVFNQLRFIEAFNWASITTLTKMIQYPLLSLVLIDLYYMDSLRVGEKQVFNAHDTDMAKLVELSVKRDWYVTTRLRGMTQHNMMQRGSCIKHTGRVFSNMMGEGSNNRVCSTDSPILPLNRTAFLNQAPLSLLKEVAP